MIDKNIKNKRIENKKEKIRENKYLGVLNTSKDHAKDRSVTCELRISHQNEKRKNGEQGKAGLNPKISGPVADGTAEKELMFAVADLLMAMMELKRSQIASDRMLTHTDGSDEISCTGSGDNADATRNL